MDILPWHTLSAEEAAARLGADVSTGLSPADAAGRLAEHGPNRIEEAARRTPGLIFLSQFKDFMIAILIAAAVISGFIGDMTDTLAIVVIVLLNAVVGFVQEYKAEKAMQALRELASPVARVVRGGAALRIKAEDVVPGDIALLEGGDIVPADMRLIEAFSLKAGEASLTGEPGHVLKAAAPVPEKDISLGDRINMAYSGTVISSGRGRGVVVATGMGTELGRIAGLVRQDDDEKTPLQKRLAGFGRKLTLIILLICTVVFAAGLLRGEPLVLMLMTAISLAVAAVPEALPAVVTISLAIGASRMVGKNVLVRRLSAVETLGSITFICTDKTGTITQNRMAVAGVHPESEGLRPLMLRAMALNNDRGDPTETALLDAAAGAGVSPDALENEYPRVGEAPFDSERKLMSTVHKCRAGGFIMFTKGAAEKVLKLSGRGGPYPCEADQAAGMRVIGFAYKRLAAMPDDPLAEERGGLIWLGCVSLMDPPRAEAAGAVAECDKAGIETVMITGDHPATALKIARDVGIHKPGSEAITGPELAALPKDEYLRRATDIRVYARVAPEQKYNIIRALKEKGHYVAMTGDGVNDAPALKNADIGISMGLTGTAAAREASDMVLLDDNFASIVNAVHEGRRIYDNIRKFIRYSMTGNSGELWTLFLAPFFGLPFPLLPLQILWINLVTDGLPGLALALERQEKNLMELPPRPPSESIFAGLGFQIAWVGLLMGGLGIVSQAWAYGTGNANWQSVVFTVICLSKTGSVLALRSEREFFFRSGSFSNPLLLFSVVLTFALQLAIVYVPFLNVIFKTRPLTFFELSVSLLLSSVVFWGVEAEKLLRKMLVKRVS